MADEVKDYRWKRIKLFGFPLAFIGAVFVAGARVRGVEKDAAQAVADNARQDQAIGELRADSRSANDRLFAIQAGMMALSERFGTVGKAKVIESDLRAISGPTGPILPAAAPLDVGQGG